jgi:hydroxymethylbilane synthase
LSRVESELIIWCCSDERLARLDDPNGDLDCIILAAAEIHHIKFQDRIVVYLSSKDFPHAAGQGALALQIRQDDSFTLDLVRQLDARYSRLRCLAERSLLRTLHAEYSSPVGVWSYLYSDEVISPSEQGLVTTEATLMMRLGAVVVHPHGWSVVRYHTRAEIRDESDAETLGLIVAEKLLVSGAAELLEKLGELHQIGFQHHFAQKEELAIQMAASIHAH